MFFEKNVYVYFQPLDLFHSFLLAPDRWDTEELPVLIG